MSFLVISLGFFIERIISVNKNTLASFFHICIPLLPSLVFMTLANAACDGLKVEQVSTCLVSDFYGKTFKFSLLG